MASLGPAELRADSSGGFSPRPRPVAVVWVLGVAPLVSAGEGEGACLGMPGLFISVPLPLPGTPSPGAELTKTERGPRKDRC